MPVPTSIADLSQTAGSNSPAGSESPTTTDDYLRTHASFIAMLRDGVGFADPVTLASAATTSIGGQSSLCVEITGTTTITSFGTTYEGPRFLRFTDALTLTHNATSLNLPGAANITTAAGDTCIAIPNTGGNGWNVYSYQRASGVQLGGLLGIQVFTSSDTYTPTAGTRSVVVEVQAGGGGSGGCVATTAGQWAAGRPGAGGAWGQKRITSSFSGVTVTVGAGGTAGSAGDNAGGTGGTSSFGALISCTGGLGGGGSGSAAASPGITAGTVSAGGTATGADVARTGGTALNPFAIAVATVQMPAGGASFYGPGGIGYVVTGNNANGNTPTTYGGGASGPANANASLSANSGAAGAPGIVIVYEYA